MVAVRAIYENGHLRLLDPVSLEAGQQVTITIEPVTEQQVLRETLGDLVRWADPTNDPNAWVEAEAEAIDTAFQAATPLSQYILEERGEA